MKKASIFTLVLMVFIWLPSCYKNYYDITDETLEKINSVSFRNDVVPIAVSGACGCHNNGTTRQIKFSWNDTIYYSAILSRSTVLYDMAKGGPHPGEGSIFFTPSQAELIIKWYEQGAEDDYEPPPITGDITYDEHIQPIYSRDCTGSTCHGGAAIPLDYTYMKNNEDVITDMMKTKGDTHPGGVLTVATETALTFLAWYAQGAPKNETQTLNYNYLKFFRHEKNLFSRCSVYGRNNYPASPDIQNARREYILQSEQEPE